MFDDSNGDIYKLSLPISHNSTITSYQSFGTTSNNSNQSILAFSSSAKRKEPIHPINIQNIILNLKVKYNYSEIHKFIEELNCSTHQSTMNNQKLSVLQLYTLYTLSDPVDMSNQTARKIYRPTLFIRKNDAFGPFNHNYLLNLFDIEYECPDKDDFPQVWKTTNDTSVTVNVFQLNSKVETSTNVSESDTTTLIGMLRAICREHNYDENSDANRWFDCLRSKNFYFFFS